MPPPHKTGDLVVFTEFSAGVSLTLKDQSGQTFYVPSGILAFIVNYDTKNAFTTMLIKNKVYCSNQRHWTWNSKIVSSAKEACEADFNPNVEMIHGGIFPGYIYAPYVPLCITTLKISSSVKVGP